MDDVSDDYDLLRRYAGGDDGAFAALVRRHTDLVYSAVRRQAGAGASADDITQATFVLLMRKADRLPPGTVIAGWLVRAVRFTALNAHRADSRRRRHERKAGHMARTTTQTNPAWAQIEPLLDDAVARLNAKDRAAVVLRFFERRSLAEVGQALGVSEHAAQMRVTRAVEKLRGIFRRRGVAVSAVAIGIAVHAYATEAAPVALLPALSVHALRTAGATGGGVAALADGAVRQMIFAQARVAVKIGIAAVIAVGLGASIFRVAADEWPTRPGKPATVDAPVRANAMSGSFSRVLTGEGWGEGRR